MGGGKRPSNDKEFKGMGIITRFLFSLSHTQINMRKTSTHIQKIMLHLVLQITNKIPNVIGQKCYFFCLSCHYV